MSRKGTITIKVAGVDRTFRFGMNAWDTFMTLQNCDITSASERLSEKSSGFLGAMRDLFYSAALCHCNVNDMVADFNRFEVGEWIDDMEQKDFVAVQQTMIESKLLGKELALAYKVLQAAEETQPAPSPKKEVKQVSEKK